MNPAAATQGSPGPGPPTGWRRRRALWDTQERHAAATAGRVTLLAAVALVAVAAPADALPRDRPAALGACLAALVLHLALWRFVGRHPGRMRLAAESSLLIDACWVVALAHASGGAESPALWLLPVLVVGAVLSYAPEIGVQSAALAVIVTLAVRMLDGSERLLSAGDGLRLSLVAALLVTAIAGRAVDAREIELRERRLRTLQGTSAALVATEDAADILAHADAAAADLVDGWDVAVRLAEDGEEIAAGDRTWRADGRVHLEVALPAPAGRPSGGVIAASRPLPRGGRGVRVRAGQMADLHALASLLTEALRRAELVARLGRLSRTDELTGLGNRRDFDESLAAELARSDRTGAPLALVLLDIDHFKRLNDRHGHPAGDAVLEGLGRLLRDQVRGQDRACRFGGEEFALLLPGAGLHDARTVAERVRRAVEAADLPHGVTVSVGVAVAEEPVPGDQLVATADARLYRAKAEGRNRVVSGGVTASAEA